MSLEIIPVWNQVTPELETELVEFWLNNQAIMDEQRAAARALQVVCVARSEQGDIVGVSTAHPRIVPRLRQPMYYYRNFIAADFRTQELASAFMAKTRDVLQQYDLSLPAPQCLGVIIELDNQLVLERREAQWKEGPTFIGYSPKGLPLRVWYFDGARLFAPAPLRRKASARVN